MNPLPAHLFVYGTLRPEFDNPAASQLQQSGRLIGTGRFPGQLYDLGSYPGAVYQLNGSSQVYGSVYELHRGNESLLAILDEYEGIGASSLPDETDEYSRHLISVDCAGVPLTCWVYLYNWPLDPARLIPSGDYLYHVSR